MTTGIRDWYFRQYNRSDIVVIRTFIIKSDLNVPTPAIPMPALAVPYAAPRAEQLPSEGIHRIASNTIDVHPNIIYKSLILPFSYACFLGGGKGRGPIKGELTADATPACTVEVSQILLRNLS